MQRWCVVRCVQVLRIEGMQNAKLWRRYCLSVAYGATASLLLMVLLKWCAVWRLQVLRIERVQNAKLWRRYCLKRDELVDARGEAGGLFVHVWWHGDCLLAAGGWSHEAGAKPNTALAC
jgi:hypothetical protein